MEIPSLDGCWVKIARAREHNYSLEQLAEAFLKRRPNQVSFDYHSEPDWLLIRAVVEPIPREFQAIAGDTIQNLRSALDLLIWQVVLTEGGTPGRHNAFPLAESESEFDRRVRNPSKGRKGPLHGIDPTGEKWAIIERAQPYKPGQALLSSLASFSNRDKHQGLLAAVSFTHSLDAEELFDVIDDPKPEVVVSFTPPNALEHDTEIVRIKKRPGAYVEMKADPPFEITVSDGKIAMSVAAFDRMRSEVVAIVRAFERFFL